MGQEYSNTREGDNAAVMSPRRTAKLVLCHPQLCHNMVWQYTNLFFVVVFLLTWKGFLKSQQRLSWSTFGDVSKTELVNFWHKPCLISWGPRFSKPTWQTKPWLKNQSADKLTLMKEAFGNTLYGCIGVHTSLLWPEWDLHPQMVFRKENYSIWVCAR